MSAANIRGASAGQRLAWLADRLIKLDRPYLIIGSQAAYQYHRWLTPLENLASIQVYATDAPAWRRLAGDGCAMFETSAHHGSDPCDAEDHYLGSNSGTWALPATPDD